MNLKALWQSATLVACALFANTAYADFIASQAQPDGSYVAPGNLATPTQATAEAVRVLRLLGRSTEVASADAYLVAETYHSTEYLSRKIVAGVDSGNLDLSLVVELATHQNSDGGYGETTGYDSNPLDTAFALDALAFSGNTGGSSTAFAANYLLQQQGGDGSWLGAGGAEDVYTTALAARALFPFNSVYSAVPMAVANACNYLLSNESTSGWGSDFLTAQALLTLATASSNTAVIQQAAAALAAAQLTDGSWSEDVYSTALALRALKVAGQSASNATTFGSISGYVLSAQSNEPLAGATVTVGASQSTQTNSAGYFVLSGVPSGSATVLASLAGYSPASVVGAVKAQQSSTVGPIILTQASGAAVVRGSVFDASTQNPISGATIVLTANASYSATAAADGSFEFDNLPPGTYSATFQASGYTNVTGSLTAPAGAVTAVKQGLTAQGVYQDSSPGTISGQIVDAGSGQPLVGATLSLNGTTSATSASDGTFSFASVPRGNYQILASATGYVARTYSFVFAAGENGALGSLSLFAATTSVAPTALTLVGTVVDGITNQPLPGATVTFGQTTVTSDGNGQFTLNGLSSLTFSLSVADSGYLARSFSGTAGGYGQVSGTFALTPASSSQPGTTSTLTGVVTDATTQKPIPGALLSVAGTTTSVTAAADGSYQLTNLQPTALNLNVSAPAYIARGYSINVSQTGTYTLNVQLTSGANSTGTFQVQSFSPQQGATGANSVQLFDARIVNLQGSAQNASILAYIVNSAGVTVATVDPYAPGTTTPTVEVGFAANQGLDVIVPWNTAQFAPGTYQVQLHVIQPGTITKAVPKGTVLTSAETQANITATSAFQGQIAFNPPLAQAGSSSPVTLSALMVNSGNVPLTNTNFTLTITDPSSGQILTTTTGSAASIGVSQHVTVNLGSWIPTTAGNLPVAVSAGAQVQGSVTGTLYVGDEATGAFTLDHSVVQLGTQDVHGTINVQGVNVTSGYSTDPLFALVKQAVSKGSAFVAPAAAQWKLTQNPQCLGCHIQSQSLVGLTAAQQKGAIDPSAAPVVAYLYNDIAGTQQADGGLYMSHHPEYDIIQTALSSWALSYWPDAQQVFPTLYKASNFLMNQKVTSGNTTWWNWTECSDCDGWWGNNEAMDMAVVTAFTGLLNDAQKLNGAVPQDFTLQDAGNTATSNMMDSQPGPDGSLWYVDYYGAVYAYNLTTQQTRTVATGLASPAYGLAVRPDGTLYVSSASTLTRVAPDGTRTVLMSGGQYGSLTSVAIGPDSLLYVVDHDRNCVYQVNDTGVVNPFACGGLLTGPHGLVFNGANLLVTNNGTGNFRIVSIAPDATVSIFADGLSFPPDWIRLGADGYFYVITDQYGSYQYTDPPDVYRISPAGLVQSLQIFNAPGIDGFNAIASIGGSIYVQNPSNQHLYQLHAQPLDTSQLAAIRAILPSVAQFTLNQYQDNNPNNALLAMRIILLNEIRPFTDDTSLIGQIDAATTSLATLLRQRQNTDGGWPYATNLTSSDPTATSFVGIALQYTHPSINDPAIRNSISFLLNSQNPDGSWPSYSLTFHRSNLAPASFVMDYLPQALEQLGGIDTGVTVTTAANVELNSPSVAPTSTTVGSDGSTTYNWSLTGVTSEGSNITFDLTLLNMAFNETRPVATAAYLGFANSFTGETLTSNISIPSVQAVGAVALAVSTDQPSYPANTPVVITSTVTNAGVALPSGQTHVIVRAADGTVISDLGDTSVGALPTGGATSVNATFNSGTLLAGHYTVESQLLDPNSQLIGDSTTSFVIVAPTQAIVAALKADKTSYQAWDTINFTSRVQNVSLNAYQAGVIETLTVQTPSGAQLFQGNFNVSSLAPSALADEPTAVHLSDAAGGSYPAQLVVMDAATHNVLATATTTITVVRNNLQALSGKVTVQAPQLYQGVAELCSETVNNLSGAALPGVTLTQQLVNLGTSQVLQTTTQSASFAAQQQQVFLNSVATGALPIGAYACVVSATYQGTTQQIGSAGFQIVQPPIVIHSTFSAGTGGRVLVLTDREPSPPCGTLSEIELWAPFNTPLPANATVQVELRDANGKTLDSEGLTLASYHGTVNRNVGKGADLAIIGLSSTVLSVDVRSTSGPLPTGYRVIATVTAPSLPQIVVDSGAMGNQSGWPLTDGTVLGDFESLKHTLYGNQPSHSQAPPNPEPDPATEQKFLSTLLGTAGLSYTLVTSADDFVAEMHSGIYTQFALLASHVQLQSQTRKELREAVFNGAGLLYAAQAGGLFCDDDPSGFGFDDTFGVAAYQGPVAASGIQVIAPTLAPVGSESFTFAERVYCIKTLGTVQVDGSFEGVSSLCKPALTTNSYGQGKAVYVGYDLLAEATRAGQPSEEASVLAGALRYLSPDFSSMLAGHVVPLQLQLANAGVATPGVVQLPLPAGTTVVDPGSGSVANGVLTWPFSLAVAQQLTLDTWIELPAAANSETFVAQIKTGTSGNLTNYAQDTLTLATTPNATLAQARALAAGSLKFATTLFWLDNAQFWINQHRPDCALLSLLSATDTLTAVPQSGWTWPWPQPGSTTTQQNTLRWDIDQVIWTLSRTL